MKKKLWDITLKKLLKKTKEDLLQAQVKAVNLQIKNQIQVAVQDLIQEGIMIIMVLMVIMIIMAIMVLMDIAGIMDIKVVMVLILVIAYLKINLSILLIHFIKDFRVLLQINFGSHLLKILMDQVKIILILLFPWTKISKWQILIWISPSLISLWLKISKDLILIKIHLETLVGENAIERKEAITKNLKIKENVKLKMFKILIKKIKMKMTLKFYSKTKFKTYLWTKRTEKR